MKSIFLFLAIFIPSFAFAQEVDLSLGDLINQTVADAQGLNANHGMTPMWLLIFALVVRFLTSAMKVSMLRDLIKWDKWPSTLKMLWAPALAVLAVISTVRPFSLATLGVALCTGAGAIVLHHLLKAIEGLPNVNSIVKYTANIFRTILRGQIPADKLPPDDK